MVHLSKCIKVYIKVREYGEGLRREVSLVLKKILDMAGRLLFPARCPICDEVVKVGETGICRECARKVQYVMPQRCCKCGKHLWQEEEEYCADCNERTHYFDAGRALYEYASVNKSLYRLKYSSRAEYAEVFGEEIAFYLKDFLQQIKPDALIPVPMHPKKERSRGYNQSVLLARAVGRNTNIPVYENYVRRVRNTVPLKFLNPEERLNNLKKAFILTENSVKLEVVVIVDDIFTTGSTIDEMSKVLRQSGVQKIYFITLAIGETI